MKSAKSQSTTKIGRLSCLVMLCALFAGWDISSAAVEGQPEIVVVTRKNQPVHQELVDSLREGIAKLGAADVRIVQTDGVEKTNLSGQGGRQPDLVVTVGTEVTLMVAALKLKSPILSVAIPRLSFDQLYKQYENEISAGQRGKLSAIFLDQSFGRRLDFIHKILPRAMRVGVALGPNTLAYAEELSAQAKRRQLTVVIGKVSNENNLIATLEQVFETSDLMMGVVDPLVFNHQSSRNILLTAHRWRIPLIGISPAYVRAGALGAVYSTPTQIGNQLAEVIKAFQVKNTKSLPEPQYPKYFNVAINYRVAESLGLYIGDELEIKLALSREERVNP